MSVPFEAIDVQIGRRIELDLENIYNKVIIEKRGGYCYELNYLFHEMLSQLGFTSFLISARIFNKDHFGPECDHMAIIVELEEQWLVDVGYGDLFLEPIQIKTELEQHDSNKTYLIKKDKSNDFILYESLNRELESEFIIKYKFESKPRKVIEFSEQNSWKQTSAESYFVKNRICTLPTEEGRKTILNNVYKVKTNGKSEQIEIEGKAQFMDLLEKEFNIVIRNTP